MSLTTEDLKKIACDAIDKASGDLKALSKDIWDHPELAYKEFYAHDSLTAFLEGRGFPVERKFVVDTGFRSVFGSGSGPNVMMVCEYDALAEVGHGCGHNLIAELGVGASLGVKAALDAAKQDGKELGKLTVLGTPAEEGGGGKLDFIQQKTFDDVTCAMMSHPWPITLQTCPSFVQEQVRVRYYGKASHAAGFPWEGVNALDAAVMAYSSISCLRQQMKPTWRICGVITNGGAKPNIIPEETESNYNMRVSNLADMATLKQKAIACFQAAATSTGCRVELEWDPKPYANVMTNWRLANLYTVNAESLGVVFNKDPVVMSTPVVSTDMGNVSQVVPSIHPLYYIGTDAANHTRDFTEATGSPRAQPYTLDQAKALAMTAIDVYCDAQVGDDMVSEFKQSLLQEGQV